MNRHDVISVVLGLGLISTACGAWQIAIEVETLRVANHDLSMQVGLAQGRMDTYVARNLNTWRAQTHFNNAVITEFGKFNILGSQRFTIESKDD